MYIYVKKTQHKILQGPGVPLVYDLTYLFYHSFILLIIHSSTSSTLLNTNGTLQITYISNGGKNASHYKFYFKDVLKITQKGE